ncbi:MAG: hypothetical protein WB460_15285, partial [Candidatus Acidiferrales bacterium]
MRNFLVSRRYWLGLMVLLAFALGSARAVDLDSTAVGYQLPDQIKWVGNPNVAETAVLHGDPMKTGLYIELVKWHAHNF